MGGSCKGKDGERGNTGATGPAGPIGPVGLTGLQGLQGIPGTQGLPGTQGPAADVTEFKQKGYRIEIEGAPSVSGVSGVQSVVGVFSEKVFLGEKGERGEKGAQGEKGDKGMDGESIRGQQGEQGEVGEKGEKGEVGEKGEIGEQGIGFQSSKIANRFQVSNRIFTEADNRLPKTILTVPITPEHAYIVPYWITAIATDNTICPDRPNIYAIQGEFYFENKDGKSSGLNKVNYERLGCQSSDTLRPEFKVSGDFSDNFSLNVLFKVTDSMPQSWRCKVCWAVSFLVIDTSREL